MSIQIGVHDITNNITNTNIRTFNNERIQLYSDVQSNLIEIVSGCNVTSFSLSNININNNNTSIHIGSSNYNSNITIESHVVGKEPYKIINFAKDVITFNSPSCILNGNIRITDNIYVNGNIDNNQPLRIDTGIIGNNVSIYAMSNDYKPFSIRSTTNIRDIISLNTNSNNFIIQPNVGIGTTIARYKLQTQGSIYSTDGIYTKFISSNLNSSDIDYYGNMVVNGLLTVSGPLNLSSANFNVSTNVRIDNLNPSKYSAIYVSQQSGSNSLIALKIAQGINTSNTVFGVSPNGYTYIGTDILSSTNMNLYEKSSKSNAMLNIYLPTSFTNDSLIKTTSYDTSNTLIISKNAYIGIGTTIVRNPLDMCLDSNTNLLDYALSNNDSIGIYHKNMPNKGIVYASSNNIPVFVIDGNGSISIGSNNKIQLTSNSIAIFDNTLNTKTLNLLNSGRAIETTNTYVLGLSNIQSDTIIGSNISTSNIFLSNVSNVTNVTTSNINTVNINVRSNAIFNNFYVDGALGGPTINIYVGQADLTYFIPDARGENSVAYFKTSNVLVSLNSNYTNEIANGISGNSNGILQVRTYKVNNIPITPGISIYGYECSSALITSSNVYYQLRRLGGSNYQIGVKRDNVLTFGLSNGINSLDYTSSYINIDQDSTVSIGNQKTQFFSKQLSSIQVSTTGGANPELESTGGFETRGPVYLRSSSTSSGLYVDNSAYVGIGTTIPRTKLDVQGNFTLSSNIEISSGIVFFNSNIGIGTTRIRKNIDIIGDAIISKNIGIGTTLPRTALDIINTVLLSGNLGIGTTNVGAYMLNVSSNMAVANSFTASNTITAQNIYGNLRGVANSAIISSNSPFLINTPNITVGTISSGSITNINTINVNTGTINSTTFIGSNITVSSLKPINSDIVGTTTGTIYATNLIVNGSNTALNPYLRINSNLSIRNQTGARQSLTVYQSGSGSSYPVADFYDGDINTVVPTLRIADGGNIGLGTTIPVAKLHVQGTGYFTTSVGIGTTQPVQLLHIEGNCCFSGNIGIGTTIPLANIHHVGEGEVIIPELTGMILHFATSTAPIGWLKCNGAPVSRTVYSNLFAMISTTYGAGDGINTFNVPDLRGVFIRCYDDGRGVDPEPGGRVFGSFQLDDFKSHVHAMQNTLNGNTIKKSGDTNNVADDTFDTRNTEATGGLETRPRNVALLACIKY